MRALALILSGIPAEFSGLSVPVSRWMRVAAERRALARLDERALADLGLDPARAQAEAARPFWDLPAQRRCF